MEKVDKGEKGGFEGAGGDVDKVQEGVDGIGFEAGKMSYVSACKHALRTSTAWLSLMTHLQGPLVRKVMSLPVLLHLLLCRSLFLIFSKSEQSPQEHR
jgi:hypothetical protein